MSVDTRNRRAAVVAYKLPFGRVLPQPDGTIDAADRGQVLGEYPGFFTSAGGGAGNYTMIHHHYHSHG